MTRLGTRTQIIAAIVIVAVLATVGGVVWAMEHGRGAPKGLSDQSWGDQDPQPGDTFATTKAVGSGGGVVKNDFVTVTVDPGTVAADATLMVRLGSPLGQTSGPYAKESWGAPVRIDHSMPLAKPVTLSWDVTRLRADQRDSIVLVRWDPAREVWATTDEPLMLDHQRLTVHVSQFSVLDFISNSAAGIGQTVGQWLGKRSKAPTCSGKPLPAWVKAAVRPDENFNAAAIRTCVEPDAQDGVVTVRVANNRSYAQHLTLAPSGTQWSWVWPGEDDFTPVGSAWTLAHTALDSKSRAVIPPTKTMAFGIARPSAPGPVQVAMAAQADATTIFLDIVGMIIDNQSVGGFQSPIINAFVQAVYECGGKELLASRPNDAKDAATMAIKAARDCVSAILDPTKDPELSYTVVNAYENALRTEIDRATRAGDTAAVQRAIKAGRLTHEISARLWYLDLFEITEYVSNQLADSMVGPTTITLQLNGAPQALGAWTPTCTDPGKDANLLYRNLALQDKFGDTSKELWQFPSWAADAATAVKPLSNCTAAQREAVAAKVDTTWADRKASAQVSMAIRDLTNTGTTFRTVDPWRDGSAAKASDRTAGSNSNCIPSEIAPRRDGFRCFADSTILDPCFANPAASNDYLCAPDTTAGSWIRLAGASRDGGSPNTDPPGNTDIFMIKLANGADCRRSTGSGPVGLPGYPYWVGWCSGGPFGTQSKTWRIGDGMESASNYPLYPTSDPRAWTAAVETADGIVQRLPVVLAWR